jgi:Rrf2 family iron-sulfur cluster assembly transcriptional regulator
MFRTDAGKYAIRAVTYLAGRRDEDPPVAAAEIGKIEDIPPYYLAKVLQSLAHAGIVSSIRGRDGGFTLARPADQIHVLEVIEAIEISSHWKDECVLGHSECHEEVHCALHDYWMKCRESLLFHLGEVTAADLASELKAKQALEAKAPACPL